MTYADIWDRRHQCKVFWRYNPVLKRLTPEDVDMADREARMERDRQRQNCWVHKTRSFLGAAPHKKRI